MTGVKVETFKNIYLGISLRLNKLLSDTKPSNFDNLFIPGFNKVTDDNTWGSGFNYTLTYSIPFKNIYLLLSELNKNEINLNLYHEQRN